MKNWGIETKQASQEKFASSNASAIVLFVVKENNWLKNSILSLHNKTLHAHRKSS